jgi:hypothetical protein
MHYKLTVKPAIKPKIRHKIQDILTEEGFEFIGGGTDTDLTECDISFKDAE